MREAELFDGTVLEFPDGTPDSVIAQTVKAQTLAKRQGQQPGPNMGYGADPRASRETMAPVSPDLQREINVARLMAHDRPNYNAGTALQQGFTLGLRDEARGLGAGVANLLKGGSFGAGYDVSMEADKRLAQEYAARNPKTAGVAEFLGGIAGAGPQLLAPGASAALPAVTSLPGRLWEGAKVGGILGAVHGAANAEGADRLTQAATGGLLGGAIGAAAPVAGDALSALARPVTNFVRSAINPEREAARRVAAAAELDAASRARMTPAAPPPTLPQSHAIINGVPHYLNPNGTLGAPIPASALNQGAAPAARGLPAGLDDAAYARALAEGQPVVLGDRGGEATRALARSAANVSPEAREILLGATQPRFLTQTERFNQTLAQQSAINKPASQIVEDAKAAARAANQPAYQKAYQLGDTDIWNPTLQRLATESPAMQTAMKRAAQRRADVVASEGGSGAQPRGLEIDANGNLVFERINGVPAFPNLRMWDLTKRELDSLTAQARRSGDDSAVRVYQGLSNQLKATLDHLPGVGPAYQAARQTAAKFFGEADAFSAGQAFSSRGQGMSPAEARKAVSAMSAEEQKLFREGYIAAERDRLTGLRDRQDATVSTFATPDARARAEIALGPGGAQKVAAQVEVEGAMNALRQAVGGNSTTARQLREMGLASAMGAPVAGIATGDWSPTNLSAGALTGAGLRFAKGNVDARLAGRIAQMLTSTDPRTVQRLTSLASRYPAYLSGLRALRLSLSAQLGATAASAVPSP